MRRIQYTVFALLITLVLATCPVAAKKTKSGTFKIFQLNQALGAERFTIKYLDGGGFKAESDITTKTDDQTVEMATLLETKGSVNELVLFQKEFTINKIPNVFVLKKENGQYQAGNMSGIKNTNSTHSFAPNALVIEPNIAHHLIPLIDKYVQKGKDELTTTVILGSELREVHATLSMIGPEPAVLTSGTFQAKKMLLNLQDVGLFLWISPENELLKVENKMQGFVMERLRYKGPQAEPVANESITNSELNYEEVTIPVSEVSLNGLLVKPVNTTNKLPALVFISDDGPHDRDGVAVQADINIGTAQLMDALSAKGLAALRYDDRGVADSGGSFLTATLSVIEDDASKAIDYLVARPDIDGERIFLIGQGAGANVAIRLAKTKAAVKGVIALAPSSISLDQLALQQGQRQLTESGVTDPEAIKYLAISNVLNEAKNTDKKWLVMGKKAFYLDNFRQYAALTPQKDLAELKKPVLLAQGGKDLQVFPQHGEAMAQVCKENDPDLCTYLYFENLDHFFMPSEGTIGEYVDTRRKVAPDFIEAAASWLKDNL